ncbi:hypothetical protein SAY86_021938 [Trapa natans]|uniref:Uncharacterized protein n=1 Tax=Trapa natans TaxID=22666 RepID=A0AAN7RKM8_TRANT|nr:hypothetical protein SAY86_021938 [Trapa natans]
MQVRALVRRASSNWKAASPLGWSSITTVQKRELCLVVLPDGVDRQSEDFARNSEAMDALLSQLHSHIRKVSPLANLSLSPSPHSAPRFVCFIWISRLRDAD